MPAPKAAKLAVAVVPIFSPITNAMPKYIGKTPVEHNKMVIAITTAEDCTIHVISVPTIKKTMIVR